jgi:hypothetical protein
MASKASVSRFVAIQEELRFGVEYELEIWSVVTELIRVLELIRALRLIRVLGPYYHSETLPDIMEQTR